jgi:hypothetical protein
MKTIPSQYSQLINDCLCAVARNKEIPRAKSQRELDAERRRQLDALDKWQAKAAGVK